MSSSAKVSVIVATRNRTDLLVRCLRSIASQEGIDFEAIIVDDGSSEEVLAHHRRVLAELGPRFKLVEPSKPGCKGTGPGAARNRGAAMSLSPFLAFLDDDDYWTRTDFLAIACRVLEHNGGDYLFADVSAEHMSSLIKPAWAPNYGEGAIDGTTTIFPDVFELNRSRIGVIARCSVIHVDTTVIRTELFRRINGFFEGLWSNAEDTNFMMRALDSAHGVYYLRAIVVRYRLPVGNSIMLSESEYLHFLQRHMAGQHVRLTCKTPEIQKASRALSAWALREMAGWQLARGKRRDAVAFSTQALICLPSVGSAVFFLKTLARYFSGSKKPLVP